MAENKKRRIETSIVRTINMGNFESVKVGCTVSTVIQDKADIKAELEKLWTVCDTEIDEQSLAYEPESPIETDPEQPIDEEVEKPEPEQESEEDDITEEEILAMKKPDLIKLVKKEELDVDTSVGVKALRVLVVDEMFEDDGDSTPDPAEDEDEGPDEDEIMAMDKDALIALIEKEELKDIDTSKGVKFLQIMIIDALFEDDEEEPTPDEETPDADNDPEAGGEWKDDDWE